MDLDFIECANELGIRVAGDRLRANAQGGGGGLDDWSNAPSFFLTVDEKDHISAGDKGDGDVMPEAVVHRGGGIQAISRRRGDEAGFPGRCVQGDRIAEIAAGRELRERDPVGGVARRGFQPERDGERGAGEREFVAEIDMLTGGEFQCMAARSVRNRSRRWSGRFAVEGVIFIREDSTSFGGFASPLADRAGSRWDDQEGAVPVRLRNLVFFSGGEIAVVEIDPSFAVVRKYMEVPVGVHPVRSGAGASCEAAR